MYSNMKNKNKNVNSLRRQKKVQKIFNIAINQYLLSSTFKMNNIFLFLANFKLKNYLFSFS
jgi:hypothetical protein